MKLIPLSRGLFSKVDDADFEWLMQWKWFVHGRTGSKKLYAARRAGRGQTTLMHRLILAMSDPSIQVDHRSRDGLDNQRCNLRSATPVQNQFNSGIPKNNTNGFIGINLAGHGRWRAAITVRGKKMHLGYHDTAEAAGMAYMKAAKEQHGEFVWNGLE